MPGAASWLVDRQLAPAGRCAFSALEQKPERKKKGALALSFLRENGCVSLFSVALEISFSLSLLVEFLIGLSFFWASHSCPHFVGSVQDRFVNSTATKEGWRGTCSSSPTLRFLISEFAGERTRPFIASPTGGAAISLPLASWSSPSVITSLLREPIALKGDGSCGISVIVPIMGSGSVLFDEGCCIVIATSAEGIGGNMDAVFSGELEFSRWTLAAEAN